MPRITLQPLDSAEAAPSVIQNGTTIGEFLDTYTNVNPSKVQILINGVATTDLSTELVHGDAVVLKPRNYSSGVKELRFAIVVNDAA